VVVGIDPLGQRVRGSRDGVRRLQHLPGVERVEVGVVVVQPAGNLVEHARDSGGARSRFSGIRKVSEALVEPAERRAQGVERILLEHGR
jgi:hypothetical protein